MQGLPRDSNDKTPGTCRLLHHRIRGARQQLGLWPPPLSHPSARRGSTCPRMVMSRRHSSQCHSRSDAPSDPNATYRAGSPPAPTVRAQGRTARSGDAHSRSRGADAWPVGWVLRQGSFEQIWGGHSVAAWEGSEQRRGERLPSTCPAGTDCSGKMLLAASVTLTAAGESFGKCMSALRFSIKVSKQQLADSQSGKKTKVNRVQPWTVVPGLSRVRTNHRGRCLFGSVAVSTCAVWFQGLR